VLLPGDVAGMSAWDAGKPVARVMFALDLFLAVHRSSVSAASIHIDARVWTVAEHPHRGPRSQWPEHGNATAGTPRREKETLPAKHLHGLACRADTCKRLEEVGDRIADLNIGI